MKHPKLIEIESQIHQYLKQKARIVIDKLTPFVMPTNEDIVRNIVLHTTQLALEKDESAFFAPIKGTCGPFTLTGTSLPVFTYIVFEKKIMEFVQVRVEIARPDKITFFSTISSTTAPERHGEPIPTTEKYRDPFIRLAHSLYHYFPLYKKAESSSVEKAS